MKGTTLARLLVILLVGAGFAFAGWQLLKTAPSSSRERPQQPVPLVDVIESTPRSHAVELPAAGTVRSAFELEIRPQVGGRIAELHPDFEPGGRIPADTVVVRIEDDDYRLALSAAQAEVAKASASIALEKGRRVVAREELDSLKGTLKIDATSQALALRKPQLRQVEAELATAENRLSQARLDLQRTAIAVPFDAIVLQRERVAGEVVAARELIGKVIRADRYWIELRTRPEALERLRLPDATGPGSRVTVLHDRHRFNGELVRVRADLADDSRLAGVIAEVPVDATTRAQLLLGSYVEARIEAGTLDNAIAIPRRAVADNARVRVVDSQDLLQVRAADVIWETGQQLLLSPGTLQPGDRIVVSRISGLVPGTPVRVRMVDPDSGKPLDDTSTSAPGNG